MIRETPVQAIRGKTIVARGRVRKDGVPRQLESRGDTLKFALAHPESMVRVLEKSTEDGGILVDDTGTFRVRIGPGETDQALLELPYYYYEVEIVEGDTGEEYAILRGRWSWIPSPH